MVTNLQLTATIGTIKEDSFAYLDENSNYVFQTNGMMLVIPSDLLLYALQQGIVYRHVYARDEIAVYENKTRRISKIDIECGIVEFYDEGKGCVNLLTPPTIEEKRAYILEERTKSFEKLLADSLKEPFGFSQETFTVSSHNTVVSASSLCVIRFETKEKAEESLAKYRKDWQIYYGCFYNDVI